MNDRIVDSGSVIVISEIDVFKPKGVTEEEIEQTLNNLFGASEDAKEGKTELSSGRV